MSGYENSTFLAEDLDGRIELARWAYDEADHYRDFGGSNALGALGNQFCGFLGEYLADLTSSEYDDEDKMEMAERMYDTAWEYYPDHAVLLDGELPE